MSTANPGRNIGWVLALALAAAVCVAISLAVQWQPESATPDPMCGGLFDECCVQSGLFDAEAHLAEPTCR